MFDYITRDCYSRIMHVEISSAILDEINERQKNKEANKKMLDEKLFLLKGHHLIDFQEHLLLKSTWENPEYGREFYKNLREFFNHLDKEDIKVKLVENNPDYICNGNCLQRRVSCFNGFNEGKMDYDKKIANSLGFEINKIYSSKEVTQKLKEINSEQFRDYKDKLLTKILNELKCS